MATSALTEIHTIRVRIWDDPLVEENGHPVHGGYVETFYLPVLGPSATWALRRLACMANARVELIVSPEDFAASLGLSHGTAHNARWFGLSSGLSSSGWPAGMTTPSRRLSVPTLSERQLRRLPPMLQAAHHQARRDRGHR